MGLFSHARSAGKMQLWKCRVNAMCRYQERLCSKNCMSWRCTRGDGVCLCVACPCNIVSEPGRSWERPEKLFLLSSGYLGVSLHWPPLPRAVLCGLNPWWSGQSVPRFIKANIYFLFKDALPGLSSLAVPRWSFDPNRIGISYQQEQAIKYGKDYRRTGPALLWNSFNTPACFYKQENV